MPVSFFFFNDTATTEIYTLSLHDALPISRVDPPKSNWAQALDSPPFYGYAVACGITFTFGGVRIDRKARVLDSSGAPIRGLYAAGEMVGGLFYGNYPGGTGLTSGAVFGRIAGDHAAREVGLRGVG